MSGLHKGTCLVHVESIHIIYLLSAQLQSKIVRRVYRIHYHPLLSFILADGEACIQEIFTFTNATIIVEGHEESALYMFNFFISKDALDLLTPIYVTLLKSP